MAKDQTVAPKERINIVYKPATNMDEEKELPLKLLVIGDFTGRADETPVEERERIDINKDNFNDVLREQKNQRSVWSGRSLESRCGGGRSACDRSEVGQHEVLSPRASCEPSARARVATRSPRRARRNEGAARQRQSVQQKAEGRAWRRRGS